MRALPEESMRWICLLASSMLVSCVGGSSPANDPALVSAQIASSFAQAGMKCLDHEPPSAVPCEGRDAGDACRAPDDDEDEPGICKSVGDGGVLCVEIENEHHGDDEDCDEHHGDRGEGRDGGDDDDHDRECRPRPLAACVGKTPGDVCTLTIADKSLDGICRAFEHDDHDVLACVPNPVTPPEPPPLVAACNGKAAGDACTIQRDDDKTFTGVCHAVPSGKLLCLPPPPKPPQEAIDACVDHQANDACAFTFREHKFQGSCRLAPDDKTLVCAPVCKVHD